VHLELILIKKGTTRDLSLLFSCCSPLSWFCSACRGPVATGAFGDKVAPILFCVPKILLCSEFFY